jgi:hypothetical protein
VKKNTFFLLCIFVVSAAYAQKPLKKQPYLKTWRVSDTFAAVDTIPADTLYLNFQDDNLIDRFSIANSFNGNLGSPIQSKIYFDRPLSSDFLFSDAYFPYIKRMDNLTFYNTKTPFSNISYHQGGSTFRKEEHIKFLFTTNFGKKLNFGTTLDFFSAWGEYKNQSAKRFNGSLFGSFDGRRYKASGALVLNNMSNFENGGIVDLADITDPRGIEAKDIPTQLRGNSDGAFAKYNYNTFFYNHQYYTGFERPVKIGEDSTYMEYVPVTRFAHTLKLDATKKRYYEPTTATDSAFYRHTYMPDLTSTNDSASLQSITNLFSVHMEEEFNKWMQFGLTAYLQQETQFFTYNVDSLVERKSFTNIKAGGILSKQQGRILRYNVQGEIGLLGYKAGNILLKGNIGTYFKLWNDSVALVAKGFMRTDEPSYFLQRYNSMHFRWENDFGVIYRTRLGGRFSIPTRSFDLDVSVENIMNHVYFNPEALPEQFSGGIQILSANLKQDFRVGKFALENNVAYQASSRQDILPLPALALFHNLYYYDLWFKVLSVQMGVNMRYHTAYYAPAYMPATGQFFVQNEMKTGNFPVVNLYLNFHLKQVRFFLQYYHFNQQFTKHGNYFSMPYYPINPTTFKTGISWNFYD